MEHTSKNFMNEMILANNAKNKTPEVLGKRPRSDDQEGAAETLP